MNAILILRPTSENNFSMHHNHTGKTDCKRHISLIINSFAKKIRKIYKYVNYKHDLQAKHTRGIQCAENDIFISFDVGQFRI